MKSAIAPIREEYDYVFLDCPPSLGLLTVNALTAADSVLIPLQCEYLALEGLTSADFSHPPGPGPPQSCTEDRRACS